MATRRRWMLGLALLLLPSSRAAGPSGGPGFLLPLRQPRGCGPTQYFDIGSLSCGECGASQRKSRQDTSCECQPGFKIISNNGGSITCEKCPDDASGVTQDGWDCIACPYELTAEGKCKCPLNEILVERNTNGALLKTALCVQCDGMEPSFAAPKPLSNRCLRCEPTFISVNKSCTV
ncbi:meckelin-like [Sceloporus undulatus]|uniref:meckelin-like n=1 Tax=Sceloporus undulatus TaxID=8520 RepID=UPI001C4B2D8A|nr:meckelin-like [Sceloporus undulatus]